MAITDDQMVAIGILEEGVDGVLEGNEDLGPAEVLAGEVGIQVALDQMVVAEIGRQLEDGDVLLLHLAPDP